MLTGAIAVLNNKRQSKQASKNNTHDVHVYRKSGEEKVVLYFFCFVGGRFIGVIGLQ
jgi:hypothetical protein